MAPDLLVEHRVEDGHRLLVGLARAGLDVLAAAWVLPYESRFWRFYVVLPVADGTSISAVFGVKLDLAGRSPCRAIADIMPRVVAPTDPVARDLVALQPRQVGGRAGRYTGDRLGDVTIDDAYIYPPVRSGLTRDEVVAAVAGLLQRADPVAPSTLTLRDGSVVCGVPFGLEVRRSAAGPVLDVKVAQDGGTARSVPADDVASIH